MPDFLSNSDDDLPVVTSGPSRKKVKTSSTDGMSNDANDDVVFVGQSAKRSKGKGKAVFDKTDGKRSSSGLPRDSADRGEGSSRDVEQRHDEANFSPDLTVANGLSVAVGNMRILCKGSVNQAGQGAMTASGQTVLMEKLGKRQVSSGHRLSFEREPANPFDEFTIRVKNDKKLKVGVMDPLYAKFLSAYLDRKSIRLTAVCAPIAGKADKLQDFAMNVTIFASAAFKEQEQNFTDRLNAAVLNWAKIVNSPQLLAEHNRKVQIAHLQRQQRLEQLALEPDPGADGHLNAGNFGFTGIPAQDPHSDSDAKPFGMLKAHPRDAATIERQARLAARAEDMFMGMIEEEKDVLQLPCAPQPARMKTQLLRHQLQGLKWMAEMEHPKPPTVESDPVQLWTKTVEDDGTEIFMNLGTKKVSERVPVLKRGGILADDMGLGKTLTTLALVRSNPLGQGIIQEPDNELNDSFCKATLIVCPLSVIANWKEQIRTHIGRYQDINYHVYHGREANIPKAALRQCDIVLTTYQMVSSDFKVGPDGEPTGKSKKRKQADDDNLKNGRLFQIAWRRIVLDEGHIIRNPLTRAAKACFKLKAERRWVLTGTPLINRPKDLGTLVTFLKVCQPYNDRAEWSMHIESKLTNNRVNATASNLLQAITSATTLRRTKDMRDANGDPIIKLPPIHHNVVRIELGKEAREIYDLAQGAVQETVRTMILEDKLKKNFTNILTFMLRLRQLACATALCPDDFIDTIVSHKNLPEADDDDNGLQAITAERKKELQQTLYDARGEACSICFGDIGIDTARITHCAHFFCVDCIEEHIRRRGADADCPMCRRKITLKTLVEIPEELINKNEKVIDTPTRKMENDESTLAQKAEKLVDLLQHHKGTQSLVFSQWTGHLRYIGDLLDDRGIEWLQYDGTLSMDDRDDIISAFKGENGPPVLLLSLACGALGLNLTNATNVFLMDPWWQGQIELQAIDRAYRIGQTKPVHVYHMVALDTIEDRVLETQKQKQSMIKAAFAGTRGAITERETQESRFEELIGVLGLNARGDRI